ncbi:hypothetical protein ABBQ38_013911 [Trebouxia sp. C0009 RCD-2024]
MADNTADQVDFTADQVDLCLDEIVQDVVEDKASAAEAAATWAKADSSTDESERRITEDVSDQPVAPGPERPVLLQKPSSPTGRASETPALREQAELDPVKPESSYPAEQEPTPRVSQDYQAAQEVTPRVTQEDPGAQEATPQVLQEYPEATVNPAAGDAGSMPNASDRAAATLSKELRKLQAESAVLQEHSRRLQEKAAVVQQQRASADQAKQGQDVFNQGRVTDQSEADSLQYGMGTEGEKEAAYQYSSDTSMPTQDGGLQWSVGGVPLQQQLRMLAVDNGMALDEGQPRQGRSSADADPTGQGLQWGAAPAAPTTISPTRKKNTAGKGPKEAQVGGINSVGALHDARNKQVPLNPLRARKTAVGQAANPIIRQQSVAQQAQAKQTRHFQDTLRKHPQQTAGVGEGSPQLPSGDPQQEAFSSNRALADVYGDSLMSSKSEPHGLYAKGTPKGGYPSQAMAGPPKAASVHDMDITPSQPGAGPRAGRRAGATKGRSKAARNPTSAPGPYAQNWGAPGMPYMGMPGIAGMAAGTMMPGMYNPHSIPHLPQLAQPNPMANTGMGFAQMGPQQAFATTNHGPGGGMQGKGSRRNLGVSRQAGSALKIPAGQPMMGAQPMQQGSFADPYGQTYGGVPSGHIPAYPMQYAPPNAAFMGQPQPQMMAGYGAALPPPGYAMSHNPRHSSPDRQSKKSRLPGGQTNYMQQATPAYAAPLPVAYSMQQSGGYRPQGMQSMQYPAMQQRAEAVQQFQMQQYQQMEASVMQQLQQKQDHALLKYGNFDHSQYKQQDIRSRPEFRTY